MKFIKELLREDLAKFDIDTSPGREWWVDRPSRTDKVQRAGHERAGEREWVNPKGPNPEEKKWSVVTGTGKVLYPNLKKVDADTIAKGRKDLIAKHGMLKVVYNAF